MNPHDVNKPDSHPSKAQGTWRTEDQRQQRQMEHGAGQGDAGDRGNEGDGGSSQPVLDPKTPASKPHGTTQDQVTEMENEGQAQQQGQDPRSRV